MASVRELDRGIDGFQTAYGLAAELVTRHSDIGFIRSYVRGQFGRALSREIIAKMRREYEAKEAQKVAARKSAYRS